MRPLRTIVPLVLATAAVAAPAIAAGAPTGAAAARDFEGTVVSVNRDNRTFRLRDTERGMIRIKVTRSTRFQRLAGFSALSAGLRNIEATVRRADGRWVALTVERSGGGGNHGDDGADDRGGDDD